MKKMIYLLIFSMLILLSACGSTPQSSQEIDKAAEEAMEIENQSKLDKIMAKENYGYDYAFFVKPSHNSYICFLVDFDSKTMIRIGASFAKSGRRKSFHLDGYRIEGTLEDGWHAVDPDESDKYEDWIYRVDEEGVGYAQYTTEDGYYSDMYRVIDIENGTRHVDEWIEGKTANEIMKELRP